MEKELIKSESYNVKKFRKIMVTIGVIVAVGLFIVLSIGSIKDDFDWYEKVNNYYLDNDMTEFYSIGWESKIGYALENCFRYGYVQLAISLCVGLTVALIGIIAYAAMSKVSLTVTDKRVYGTATFGKRVDLPLDSVSAIALGGMKGIAVTTASGAIKFALIKNREAMYDVVSKLLVDRQNNKKVDTTQSVAPQNNSNADELKKFKDLLDSGVITQEEFDAKKKQLLGL